MQGIEIALYGKAIKGKWISLQEIGLERGDAKWQRLKIFGRM
jgi:hypothetical protein